MINNPNISTRGGIARHNGDIFVNWDSDRWFEGTIIGYSDKDGIYKVKAYDGDIKDFPGNKISFLGLPPKDQDIVGYFDTRAFQGKIIKFNARIGMYNILWLDGDRRQIKPSDIHGLWPLG